MTYGILKAVKKYEAAVEETRRLLISQAKKAQAEASHYRTVLQSIASNTCCEKCQEAALVARAALASTGGEHHAE